MTTKRPIRVQIAAAAALLALFACKPAPQPQPNEMGSVTNATRVDVGVPAGPVANELSDVGQGAVTPGERGPLYDVNKRTPGDVAADFATYLNQRNFAEAYALWDPQATTLSREEFAGQFDGLQTIHGAVGEVGPAEGAAGSIYDDIQLTLTGKTEGGENYSLTGPLTVKRVNDVPGSTAEQRSWRIVKLQLTGDAGKAQALIKG